MRVEYEKLFATPDELVDFLCKSDEEQGKILAELLSNDKECKNVELSCHVTNKGISGRT